MSQTPTNGPSTDWSRKNVFHIHDKGQYFTAMLYQYKSYLPKWSEKQTSGKTYTTLSQMQRFSSSTENQNLAPFTLY